MQFTESLEFNQTVAHLSLGQHMMTGVQQLTHGSIRHIHMFPDWKLNAAWDVWGQIQVGTSCIGQGTQGEVPTYPTQLLIPANLPIPVPICIAHVGGMGKCAGIWSDAWVCAQGGFAGLGCRQVVWAAHLQRAPTHLLVAKAGVTSSMAMRCGCRNTLCPVGWARATAGC